MVTSVDIELFASFCFEAVYIARYELICALLFLVGWLAGSFGKSQRAPTFTKSGSKHARWQKGKEPPAHTRPAEISKKIFSHAGSFDGRIERVDPKFLKDASWVVPQVCQLCHTQVPQAILLYRAALHAGFKLTDIPEQACGQLFMALVTASIRTGKLDEARKLLADLRQCGLGVNTCLFGSVVKLCTSRQLFVEALSVFDFVSEDPNFALTDKTVWSCLLFCATEAKDYHKCIAFFDHVKAYGTPSPKDFGNMLRLAALQGDWKQSLALIQEMRDGNVGIDCVQYNTTLATCVGASQVDQARALLDAMESVVGAADVITYNTIIKGYAKAGQIDECFALFEHMHAKSMAPSQVTYGILLDCCINQNQMDRAMSVVSDMTATDCPMNTVLYTTLIKGFARAGDLQSAMDLYDKMKTERGVSPDLITFSILIKANCDKDRLEEALKLLEEMIELGLRPDEVVFNNLIVGCTRLGNAKLGQQLYDDMVKSGVRPSNATFSILLRLYHQCKLLEEAVVLLKTEPAKHNVEPEPRLFVQLVLACIRERQGQRATEVYGMLAEHSTPTATAHSSILTTCTRFNMYGTAAEIVSIAVGSGACIDPRDTASLLEGASKKGKTEVVRSLLASMQALGRAVDTKFAQAVEPESAPQNLASAHSVGSSGAPKQTAPWRIAKNATRTC